MKRTVNGVDVEVPADEAAAIEAKWARELAQRRRPKELAALKAELLQLPPARLQRILVHVLAEALQIRPTLARDAGEAIDGDERW